MRTKVHTGNIIKNSPEAKKRLSVVAEQLKGKELFADKIEFARKALKGIDVLPM